MVDMSQRYPTLASMYHADSSANIKSNHERAVRQRLEADSTFRTGIMADSGELFVAVPRQMSVKLESILDEERDIALLWSRLPGVMRWNYIYNFIAEELVATNEMEGVHSTKKEADLAVKSAKAMVNASEDSRGSGYKKDNNVRFGEFAKLYMNLTDEKTDLPQTLQDLRMIYDQAVQGEIDDKNLPDGEIFRKEDVEITGPHGVVHRGVAGEARISSMLTSMLYLTNSDEFPRVLSAIVSHFVFEYVHPFYDGNGRTGRYLLALYLCKALELPTVLSLARIIAENKNVYYKAFSEAEDTLNAGELTSFVLTMLDFISQAQHNLNDALTVELNHVSHADKICQIITKERHLSSHADNLLFKVMQEELFDNEKGFTLDDAAEMLNLSKQSARRYCRELEKEGLIVRVSKKPLRLLASPDLRARISSDDSM
ncbi:Fic family protein [Bifidobacterium sp. ESL0745]|uniref:Fic family protein n=1 Tax=Bifidobacterium sp. ESL0745 TaxID=2983226 RepID=UPI0023F6E5AD|nr:Fic family protein [Bifidobacterium sp. ESL0745]MDF7665575.1 Fic family protein [Bifidobacterium sp. ESL0745]